VVRLLGFGLLFFLVNFVHEHSTLTVQVIGTTLEARLGSMHLMSQPLQKPDDENVGLGTAHGLAVDSQTNLPLDYSF
jgi:hypothetical protein